MRIDNGGNPIQPNVPPQQTQSAPKADGTTVGSTPHDSLTSVNANSIEGLLQSIVSGNEIRESVINEIRLKIQTGEYLAKESALQTASSILNL